MSLTGDSHHLPLCPRSFPELEEEEPRTLVKSCTLGLRLIFLDPAGGEALDLAFPSGLMIAVLKQLGVRPKRKPFPWVSP